jgi:hypothetical protein
MSVRGRDEDTDINWPVEPKKNCYYEPIDSHRRLSKTSTPRKRPMTGLHSDHLKSPAPRQESDIMDMFLGTKRSFLVCHQRKGVMAVKIGDVQWKMQEKQKALAYQRELDLLTTNIRVRDDETLRRSNKPRPKWDSVFIPATTGPRPLKKLPREIQDTTHPRRHVLYFGP